MTKTDTAMPGTDPGQQQRIDLWIWHARFVKTRTRTEKLISGRGVRVNGTKITKPSYQVKLGDVLTFVTPAGIHLVRVIGFSPARSSAKQIHQLYEKLALED